MNDSGGSHRTPGQRGGAASRTPTLQSRSNAGVQIPMDYFAQFSRVPASGYFGYHQTLARQYPGMDMSTTGWGNANRLVGMGRAGDPWTPLVVLPEVDEDADRGDGGDSSSPSRSPSPSPPMPDFSDGSYNAANGGLVALANGGVVRGPGDGTSDSIPAMIDGHQPAAISQGEFIIPADVVSGLGNGSTEAGAQRLYALMDQVRRARRTE